MIEGYAAIGEVVRAAEILVVVVAQQREIAENRDGGPHAGKEEQVLAVAKLEGGKMRPAHIVGGGHTVSAKVQPFSVGEGIANGNIHRVAQDQVADIAPRRRERQ